MEAGKHEEIAKELEGLIEEYLNISNRKENDLCMGSLYMGNWIADFSQLLDEGVKAKVFSVFSFVHKANKSIKNISSEIIKRTKKKNIKKETAKLVNEYLAKKNLDSIYKASNFLVDIGGNEASENALNIIESMGRELGKGFSQFADLLKSIKSDEGVPNPEILKTIEVVLFAVVKFLAFRKFVVTADKSMPIDTFNTITDELLTTYFPHDHLDRYFDYEKVYKNDIDLETLDDDPEKYLQNDAYSNLAKEYINTKSIEYKLDKAREEILKFDFLDDKEKLKKIEEAKLNILSKGKGELGLYGYLEEDLLIACGKLSELQIDFRRVLNRDKSVDINLALAKLGKALHVFEDYYAHSNYIDFLILLIYQISKENFATLSKIPNSIKFKDFFNKNLNNNAFSNQEINRSIRSLVKTNSNKKAVGLIDDKISTGYFGSEDIFVSLYHVFIGFISKISVLDSEESIFEEENLNKLVEKVFVEDFEEELKQLDRLKSKDGLLERRNIIQYDKEVELAKLDKKYNRILNWYSNGGVRYHNHKRKYAERKKGIIERYQVKLDAIDEMITFNQKIEDIQQLYLNGNTDPENIPSYFSKEDIKNLFSRKGDFLFSNNKEHEDYILGFLFTIFNGIIFAEHAKLVGQKLGFQFDIFKTLFKYAKIVKTTGRIVKILTSYQRALPKLLRMVIFPWMGEKTKEKIKDAAEQVILYNIEKWIINLLRVKVQHKHLDEFRTGSHALMAKDEEYEKKNLHRNAMSMATYIDKYILKHLFYNKPKTIKIKILKSLQKGSNVINYRGYDYDWGERPDLNQNINMLEIYDVLLKKYKELAEDLYFDWYYMIVKLSYESAIPKLINRKLPHYKVNEIKDEADQKDFDNIELDKNRTAIYNELEAKNKMDFDNRTTVSIFGSKGKLVQLIKMPYKNLNQINIDDQLPTNSVFMEMILNHDSKYEGEITMSFGDKTLEETKEFFNLTQKIEEELKCKYFEMSNKIAYDIKANCMI